MKKSWRVHGAVSAGFLFGLGTALARGQAVHAAEVEGGQPQVIFKASAPHATELSYTFRVRQDGSGTFEPGPGAQAASGSGGSGVQDAPMPLTLSAKTTGNIFGQVQALRHLGFACGAKMKGVADMGTKWVEYRGPDGTGSCTYNYTQNRAATALAETFGGVALTLEEGRKLAHLHRYDRLGLNEEMDVLVKAVQSGQATEPGTIAPVLQSLVDDSEVLERVRVRAASLLKMAGSTN